MQAHFATRTESLPAIQWRMDVKTVRRQNLVVIEAKVGKLAEIERLTAVALGEDERVRASYLSQVKGGRGMGDHIARRLERWLDVENGWMDRPQRSGAIAYAPDPAMLVVREEPAEFSVKGGAIAVDQLDVRGSMGAGIPLLEREPVIDSIRVPIEYIRANFAYVTNPDKLKIITGWGNSMAPTFKHGDPLIVDTSVNTMDVDTVYVFAWKNELYIKGVQRIGESIRVISHNRAEADPFNIGPEDREEVHVIGRVICAINLNKIA